MEVLEKDLLKRNDNYLLRTIKNISFLIPINWNANYLPSILCLNEIGAHIWSLLSVGRCMEEIIKEISSEYHMLDKDIVNDISEFLSQLIDTGAIISNSKQILNNNFVNVDQKDFLYRIIKENFAKVTLPISLTWELTFQCNLNCVHCYTKNDNRTKKKELSLKEIVRFIEQIAKEGCLQVIITGGEPLFRKDIFNIITELKKYGIFYLLYTNGTLIDEETADFLVKYPPIRIELSMYGFTEQSYEKITRKKGSYKKFRNGINLLLSKKLDFSLKSIAMKDNYHEIALMRGFAEKLDVDFRFDPLITPTINGSFTPTNCRLSPKQIVEIERQNTISKHSNIENNFSEKDFYRCGAGKYESNIDPYGRMSLCLLDRRPFYNLKQGSFEKGWKFVNKLREVKYPSASLCLKCESRNFCKICPGWLKIEKQPSNGKVDFICNVAKERFLNLQREEV